MFVRRICESTLHAKHEVLAHTANKAALANFRSDNQDKDTSDDEQRDDDDDDDDNETYENQPENNANERISTLLKQISLWRMPDVPHR